MLDPRAGFRIASVTKTFTAAAVLRLVESGRVGLDDPIARHLSPATLDVLRKGGYDADTIRVRHLLTHTSGLYDYASDPAFVQFVLTHGRHHWTRREQVRFAMTHGKPYGAPGAEFHYSDTGYVLLGEILERTTGGGLARAYRSLLSFRRLGLADTYLESLEPRPRGAHARTHQYYETIDSTAFDPSFDLYGGGGLVSTVDDLARFYRALFHGRVFKLASTLRVMLGRPNPRSPDDLGMGIFSNQFGGRTCWGHSGFWGRPSFTVRARTSRSLSRSIRQRTSIDRRSGFWRRSCSCCNPEPWVATHVTDPTTGQRRVARYGRAERTLCPRSCGRAWSTVAAAFTRGQRWLHREYPGCHFSLSFRCFSRGDPLFSLAKEHR